MPCKFFEMLNKRWDTGARICVGLDSEWEKIPEPLRRLAPSEGIFNFNMQIIRATKDVALAYKPNYAFYNGATDEKSRDEAQHALLKTIDYIHRQASGVPVILDAKRADIGNTNRGYVLEAFEHFDADAITVNPYFGMEAIIPFLEKKDKGIIVLCRTSNPGAGELQDLRVSVEPSTTGLPKSKPLYQVVARNVAERWGYNNNCALVVGATYPEELGEVRKIVGDMWLLIPGIGKQGGDLQKSVQNGINSQGRGIIINSSSGIIFAPDEGQGFAFAARRELDKLTAGVNAALPEPGSLFDRTV